jgi:hypothetical protein
MYIDSWNHHYCPPTLHIPIFICYSWLFQFLYQNHQALWFATDNNNIHEIIASKFFFFSLQASMCHCVKMNYLIIVTHNNHLEPLCELLSLSSFSCHLHLNICNTPLLLVNICNTPLLLVLVPIMVMASGWAQD